MIKGISHIGLEVTDPARTALLFQKLFSAKIINRKSDNELLPQTYVNFAGLWFVLIEGDGNKLRNDDHIALAVSEEDLDKYALKLTELGLEYRYSQVDRKPKSLYFFDYDNHFFELQSGFLNDEFS